MRLKLCLRPLLTAAAMTVFIAGCKSPQAQESVFIPPEYAALMRAHSTPETAEETGMHEAWGKPELIKDYDKIKVAVVISPKQLSETWWEGTNGRYLFSTPQDDLQYVAEYARESFMKSFKNSKRFKLVTTPGPKTLVLEFAIVQLVPNKPVLGAVSNLGSLTPIGAMMIPLKLGAKSASGDSGGAIAMESVIRDSTTGQVLAVFADREKGKTSLFSFNEFTPYSNARAIINRWTDNIVIGLDQVSEGKKVKIKEASGFTLIDY